MKAGQPSVNVRVSYTGSFSDVRLASKAAQSFLQAGADVMTGTAQMVVGAVAVAKANGVPWFGTQSNQTQLAPDVVVSSQVYHWEVVLEPILDGLKSGVLGGKNYEITLDNGGEVIEFNDDYRLPPEIRQEGEAAIEGIKSGSIKLLQGAQSDARPR